MPTDALLSQSIGSLINGISEQPANLRQESQAEAQVNCTSDVAKGVRRRFPFEHVAPNSAQTDLTSQLGSLPTDGYFTHIIDLGAGKRFVLFIEDGTLHVFDLANGNEIAVDEKDLGATTLALEDIAYLDTTAGGLAARDTFEAITIGDTTFIVNKTISTALDTSPSAGTRPNEFLLFIKQPTGVVQLANTVSLTIGALAVVEGSHANSSRKITDALLTALTGGEVTAVGSGVYSEWTFTRVGDNVIHGEQDSGTLVQTSATDAFGDSIHEMAAVTITGGAVTADASIQAFSDLPEKAVDGFVVKVSGDNGKEEDDYYVQFDLSETVWKETIKTGLGKSSTFLDTTMPHVLLFQQSSSDFDFGPASAAGPFPDSGTAGDFDWKARLVGDLVSAPSASFVGFPIKDVSVHKNRLVFASDDNVIASEAADFFNFWPTTVTEILDSDTFDIAATGNKVSIIDYMVPFANGVSLFSSIGDTINELVGSRDEQLTLKNARVEERAVLANTAVRPAQAGDSIYYSLDRDNRTGIFQYKQRDIGVFQSIEITSHVPEFVPQSVFAIAPGRAENMLAILSSATGERNTIYVYRFWQEGTDLVMSSWSKYTIDTSATIEGVGWVDSVLYAFIQRQDSMHIEKLDFGKSAETSPFTHRIHLDSQLSLTGAYVAGTNVTTWTLPYDQDTNGGTYKVITGEGFGTAGDERGINIQLLSTAADLSITAEGDWSAAACYIGRVYESSYEMSEIVQQANSRVGDTARISGRLQLKRGRVVYDATGTFDVEVTSRDDDDDDIYTYTFTSEFINQAVIGPRDLDDGVFEFDIGGNAQDVIITYKSSAILPFILSSFEWEGRFYQRSTQT